MINEIISGGKWTLVWENEDPSLGFPPQTIQIDLSNKKEILVKIVSITDANHFVYYPCMVGGEHRAQYWTLFASTSHYLYFYTRNISADLNGVTFGKAYRKYSNSTSAPTTSSTNSIMKPIAIYAR